MKSLEPYLFFNGQCRQALEFYCDCLGGNITHLQTFDQAPGETPPGTQGRVMHARFEADGFRFMASDTVPDLEESTGSQVALSLGFDDPEEQVNVFDALSEGGNITMGLQDTFWGARFGMLTDRFDIHWMLSYSRESQ